MISIYDCTREQYQIKKALRNLSFSPPALNSIHSVKYFSLTFPNSVFQKIVSQESTDVRNTLLFSSSPYSCPRYSVFLNVWLNWIKKKIETNQKKSCVVYETNQLKYFNRFYSFLKIHHLHLLNCEKIAFEEIAHPSGFLQMDKIHKLFQI